MKLKGEVLKVETLGDKLRVTGQMKSRIAADWQPCLSLTVDLPETVTNRKAFYVGRSISVEVKPR